MKTLPFPLLSASMGLLLLATPSLASPQAWTPHDLTDPFEFTTRDCLVSDLDGDGDGDIVYTCTFSTFSFLVTKDASLDDVAVIGSSDIFSEVEPGDVDGDGDTDLFIKTDSNFYPGSIYVLVNHLDEGQGWTFDPIVSDDRSFGTYFGAIGDLDGDGDDDVEVAGSAVDGTVWFESNVRDGGAWIRHDILDDTQYHSAADVDQDGDVDLLTTDHWLENVDGRGLVWKRIDIDLGLAAPFSQGVHDIDQDGDPDLFALDGGKTYWVENPGGVSTSWVPHLIDDTGRPIDRVYDMDGDGDVDFLRARSPSSGRYQIGWFENRVRQGRPWRLHRIFDGSDALSSFAPGDVDGDGRADIAASTGNPNARYHRHVWLGQPAPGTPFGPGGGSLGPLEVVSGVAAPGSSLVLRLGHSPVGQVRDALVVLALSQRANPSLASPSSRTQGEESVPGDLLVDLSPGALLSVVPVAVGVRSSGEGVRVALSIPEDPALQGLTLYAQGLALPIAGGSPTGLTRGLRLPLEEDGDRAARSGGAPGDLGAARSGEAGPLLRSGQG